MMFAVLMLAVFLLAASGFAFFFFCFFVPALRAKYYGTSAILSAGHEVGYEAEKEDAVRGDPSLRAVVATARKDGLERRLSYAGMRSCAVFCSAYGTEYHGFSGCAGFGDCMAACRQDAIELADGVAVVTDLCDGCGACLSACPVSLISLVERGAAGDVPAKKRFTFWLRWYRMVQSKFGRS